MRTESRRAVVRDQATIDALRRELLDGPGVTGRELREAVLSGDASQPRPVATFSEKVRDRSFDVSQEEIDALRAAGYDEDAVFEVTVLAATGAASSILEATLRAIEVA